jgi:hypothetical protein
VAKAFKDLGQPRATSRAARPAGPGCRLRYGTCYLYLKNHNPIEVFWQSPSVGLDSGSTPCGVHPGLRHGAPEDIFRRYPGGGRQRLLYRGFGMTYQRSENITLAPIRFGVGLRLGANVGYQHKPAPRKLILLGPAPAAPFPRSPPALFAIRTCPGRPRFPRGSRPRPKNPR